MDKSEIVNKLKKVFCGVFKLREEEFNGSEATIDNLDEWDSLSHVTLILQIQKTFSCKIPQELAIKFDSFNSIVDYLTSVGDRI